MLHKHSGRVAVRTLRQGCDVVTLFCLKAYNNSPTKPRTTRQCVTLRISGLSDRFYSRSPVPLEAGVRRPPQLAPLGSPTRETCCLADRRAFARNVSASLRNAVAGRSLAVNSAGSNLGTPVRPSAPHHRLKLTWRE